VCDVVVSLDGELKIIGSAARLSALVMLQERNFEGSCLHDLMPQAEDREAFTRCMASPAHGEGSVPRAVHSRFRDCFGNLIHVELFCVRVPQQVGVRCFVGIREFSDSAPLPECRTFTRARGSRRRPRMRGAASSSGAKQRPSSDPTHSVPELCRDTDSSDSDSARSGSDDKPSSLGSPPSPTSSGEAPDHREHDDDARGGSGTSQLSRGASVALKTSEQAIHLAVVRLMRMLSLPSPKKHDCCPFHSRISWLKSSLRSLGDRQCVPRFGSTRAAQCGMCGMLADSDAAKLCRDVSCFACGATIPSRRARATTGVISL